ncbi:MULTISPECIES: response regulator [unclassified Butyrivibrio]|uniref:response regulator transcription factor n=1 Tax=unclassified Butyrivibrio TaxID=2639466 RepID=UPI0003B64A95|nr:MULTISPECIES: response regulator [unclassified Butyrivibrio]SDB47528.1 two-component system, response regulator YesN [Butyrivibrio sp. INlla16]SEL81328.1 two-component system, response regulator YesN [Butyrivibrio sp. ob235]
MYRVLIVEDEDIIRKGIAYTMDWTGMGCTIAGEAANGKEGLEKIEELSPDIVLADIMMPVMDGIEMIRKGQEISDFKAIIMTSYADFEYAKQAIDLGVSAYLMKPVDEEELRKNVAKVTSEIEKDKQIKQLSERKKSGDDLDVAFIKSDKDNDYIQQIIERTRERYSEKISLDMFSEELGVSSSYLSRKFKEATGQTYLDFLNRYRVSQAVKLLETGTYKVYEVSELTGFSDYKYFSTVFKKYAGSSPSDFVK